MAENKKADADQKKVDAESKQLTPEDYAKKNQGDNPETYKKADELASQPPQKPQAAQGSFQPPKDDKQPADTKKG